MHLAYFHYVWGPSTALNHVRQFVTAAEGLGHRVDVFPMNLAPAEANGPTDLPLSGHLRRALKNRFARYLHDPKEFYWNLGYIRKETALLRQSKAEVVLVRTSELGISSVFAAKRLDLPLILEVNAPPEETLYFDQYHSLTALKRWAAAFRMRHAHGIVVVSSTLRDHLASSYDVSKEKITVAPNGADVEVFAPGILPDLEYRASPGQATVGFVGSFQKFHGAAFLVEMVTRVATMRPAVRFLLVGDGPVAAEVRSKLGENPQVLFTGSVPHERVPGLVACLDVAVLPETAFYTSPLKVVEWMAAGRAIAAPRYGPLEELIDDGIHGLLFPPRDSEAMVAAVVRLIDQPELRRHLGDAAAARVRQALTWRDNARRVISACRQARLRYETERSS